ncbi:hypothetical protein [Xanthomonas sontii]|uniref:Uncharacterized protein n=1 Tax=Xanthomonas sontii TaxID=2650745 RepID=A0A6N7Q6N8_9XANT|nr:hypothetical protein [Xanthomonas sontii]MRG99377.1 hypothetical protein [Xanthomonas sontii]MRH73709.1 hypothetical protein [Xanthomonas sontii]
MAAAVVADQHMARQAARDLEGRMAFGQASGGVQPHSIGARLPGLGRAQGADGRLGV